MALSFRRAIRSDIPQMHVVRLAVRENPLTSNAIQECHYIPQIEATGRGWVAQVNGRVVGFAIGNAETGNIWALFMHPDYERLGVGRKLHDTMTDWLFSQGLPSLNLGTAIGTRAQKFYERAGWRFVGERGGEALYVLTKERDTPIASIPLPSTLRSLFAYKAWANEELFGTLASLDAEAHPAEAHTAIRILNHVYVTDCIFKAHLAGRAHSYATANTKETPTLHTLAAAVKEVDAWFLSYVTSLPTPSLQEPVRFLFTDGDAGLMSREEILMHVITHGGYHRGAAGQVMRTASVAPPRDIYTRFLHSSEPERRQ